MCKKQTSVSYSSTESEIISLDAGLRMDGVPALDLCDLTVAVLGNTNQSNKAQGDLCTNQREVRAIPHTFQKRKKSHGMIDDLDNVDYAFQQNLELSLLIQVSEWMEFPLSIFGTSLVECCVLLPTNQRDPKRMYRKPAARHTIMKTNQEQKFILPTSTTILNYATSILFLQT